MRVIVCGGRSYGVAQAERLHIWNALDGFHRSVPITVLIHGGAPGTDTEAGNWAFHRQLSVHVFVPDWARDGKRAGHIRNERMLREGSPQVVIAFPGGAGTADMVRRAKAAGVTVVDGARA